VNAALQVSSSVIGVWIPGFREYAQLTLDAMQDANPTQFQRMEFCFFATIYTIVPVLFFLIVIAILIFMLLPPILMIFEAVVTLFFASPLVVLVPGANASSWFPWGTRGQQQQQEQEQQGQEQQQQQGTLIERYLYGLEELKRKKRE